VPRVDAIRRLNVAVLDDYQSVALDSADWSVLEDRASVRVIHEHLEDEDAVVDALQSCEVVVAMRERTPFRRSALERLPRLELLVTTGDRNAAIDVTAAHELGVTVCGTRGSGREAGEHTWALILAAARRLDVEIANVRDNGWMTTVGTSLEDKRLGVLGLGRLGAHVAAIGKAFGMKVTAWSENLDAARCRDVGVELAASLDELMSDSDFVTIHLILSRRTRGLVGARELALMRPTAWLINTSRGPICDEEALAEACAAGRIAGAALDVFGTEPLPPDHPFRTLPNVIATPHIGYVTDRAYQAWYQDVVDDVVAYLDGAPIRVIEPRP
jgi:phosphoglycerate dehydrogenase-like enzyme